MRKNHALRGLVAGLAGLALLLAGVAVASNMGFKFVPNLPEGAYSLSLPWNNNYTNAQSLLTDLHTGGAITSVERLETGKTFTTWDGFGGGVNFAIAKPTDVAYVVNGGGGGATPVVVGSHDPNHQVTIGTNQNFNASAPYHQTHTNAQALLSDINGFCGGCVGSVERLETGKTFTTWDGFGGGVNFSLSLGLGVVINTGGTGLTNYTWPHY